LWGGHNQKARSTSKRSKAITAGHCHLVDAAPKHSGEYYSQISNLYPNPENRPGGWPMPSPNPHAHDAELAEKLYHNSLALVGLDGKLA
jgi:hypothetical protein